MQTFTGQYNGRNFILSGDTEAIRAQLISILNTPKGSRFYYPEYGSNLNRYRFSVLNQFNIEAIGDTIKDAVDLIEGVTLTAISYTILNNNLYFNIELNRLTEKISIRISVVDGVAS